MSNFISFKDEDIFCSNGLMDVLLTAIGLSGSRLAVDEDGSCVPKGYPKCPEHGILLSIFGCLACNDR